MLPFPPTLKRIFYPPSALNRLHAAVLYTPVWSTTALKNEAIGIFLYFGKSQTKKWTSYGPWSVCYIWELFFFHLVCLILLDFLEAFRMSWPRARQIIGLIVFSSGYVSQYQGRKTVRRGFMDSAQHESESRYTTDNRPL